MKSTRTRPPRHVAPTVIGRRAMPVAAIVFALVANATVSAAQPLKRSMPESLTDREFWQFFSTMSEEGGSFLSENFVSNEQTYQYVIPTLQRTITPNGVYLGVGPEQNFTYITNLKPRMAVIFDIRRQNAMAHLMYKALFDLSPTRADFISHLFSRPLTQAFPASATAAELFAAAQAAKMSDSAFDANRQAILDQLMQKHGFALTPADIQSIKHVYASFFEAGPDINYGYRPGTFAAGRSMYATYEQIQTLANAAGVNQAFLATEENYRWLRALHAKNLVIPVVGDFAGPSAIRSVGDYVRQRGGVVTTFYLSNVEQYLFRQLGDAERFYRNVETLPIDSTSRFIRSVPPNDPFFGGTMSITSSGGYSMGSFSVSANRYSVQVLDSAGVRIIMQTIIDSTGRSVTTRTIDTSSTRSMSPLEIFRRLQARDDSLQRARADSARRAYAPPGLTPPPARDTTIFVPSPVPKILRDTMPFVSPVRPMVVSSPRNTLVSGIASIRQTVDAFLAGQLKRYDQAISMTKTDGWK